MKEADLPRLFHRPRVPTPSGAGRQRALAGRTPALPPLRAVQPPAGSPPNRSTAAPGLAGLGAAAETREAGGGRSDHFHLLPTPRPPANIPGRGGLQLPAFPWRAAKTLPLHFPGRRAQGCIAPPPRPRRGRPPARGEPARRPESDAREPGRPRSSSHTPSPSSPSAPANPKVGLGGHPAGTGERRSPSQRGKHTLLRGVVRSPSRPSHPAAETHLPPLPSAAGKLGALMAPREEGSQAERMSPQRHPFTLFLSLPLAHAHLESLASGGSPTAGPLRPPSRRRRKPESPHFRLNNSPPPLHLEQPPQCGNVPAAQTDRSSRQSGTEAAQGLANEISDGGRGRGVCGSRKPSQPGWAWSQRREFRAWDPLLRRRSRDVSPVKYPAFYCYFSKGVG